MFEIGNDLQLHVGDSVLLDAWDDQEGSVESIRVISNATLVENYNGSPSDIVVTVKISDSFVNERGINITPVVKEQYA